jgi:hypothetical protein
MCLRKPTGVSIEQVRIAREGNDAIVDHAEAGISGAHLALEPETATMTDAEILDLYNGILESQHRLLAEMGPDGHPRTTGAKANRLSRRQRSMGPSGRRAPLHHRRRWP